MTQQYREYSLADLGAVLARRRWLLLAGLVLGLLGGLAVACTMPATYRAETLLAPVTDSDRSLAGRLESSGGLASLAGLSLGSNSARKFEGIALLQSRALTEGFVEEHGLLPVLFSRGWDSQGRRWLHPQRAPTLWDANELFERRVRHVIEDRRSGLITLTIDWNDPALAAQWANDLVGRANHLLRQRAIERAQRNRQYLEEQLNQTSVIEMRQAMYRLIEDEIKTIMLAQGSEEYAFKVIDPAVPPQKPVWPRRGVFAALGAMLGLMLSIVAVLLRPRARPASRVPAS